MERKRNPRFRCRVWATSRILDRSSHKSQIPCTALDQNLIGFPRNEPTKIDANARIQPAPCFSPTRCWVGRSDRQLVQSDERFGQVARNEEILIYYLGLALIPVSERVDVKKPNYWAGKAILYTQKAPAPVLRADHTAESLIVARALSRRTEDDPTRNHDDQASQHDQLELVQDHLRDLAAAPTPELSDASGPVRPHWQLTRSARIRSSDFDTPMKALVGFC